MRRRAGARPDGAGRATRAGASRPRVRRLPVLVLLAVVAAAAVAVRDRGASPVVSLPVNAQAVDVSPVAPGPDVGVGTWFCAGGTAVPGGAADHILVVTNVGDEPARGDVQVFPVDAEPVAPQPLEVAAHSQVSFRLGDAVAAEHDAAMVELRGGSVVVEHEVRGPGNGHDLARCTSQASSTWYFPWGQTTLGSSLRLALFNPFPGDAVVDITFDTEDGYRSPEKYQAMLVPAHRLVVVPVEAEVTRRQRVSTRVVARSGRLVVDRLQTLTAADGSVAADVSLGAPAAAATWYFADGRVDPGTVERFVVFNPGDHVAEASLTLLTGAGSGARGEPFELRIAPGTATEVTLNREPRVPQPLLHAAVVQAEGDVPVVAERVLLTGGFIDASPGAGSAAPAGQDGAPTTTAAPTTAPPQPAPPAGAAAGAAATLPALPADLAASMGTPVVASRWLVGVPAVRPTADGSALAGGGSTVVAVLNPSGSDPVDVAVDLIGPSGRRTARRERVDPGRRIDVDVPLGTAAYALVEAAGPVVVGRVSTLVNPSGFGSDPALPFAPASSIPTGPSAPRAGAAG